MKDSMNIRAGDIPETDAEVEKLLAKKDAARPKVKTQPKNTRQERLVPSDDGKSIVDRYNESHPLPPEINPALLEVGAPEVLDSAERAASGSGWQGEEVEDTPSPSSSAQRPSNP